MSCKRRVLIIDLEYTRDEINEPVNIDTIMDAFDSTVQSHIDFDLWYRTMGDLTPHSAENYDAVLISTKVSAGEVLRQMLDCYRHNTVIVGGVIATYAYDELLSLYPNVILSLGECENNLNAILSLLLKTKDLNEIKAALIEKKTPGVAFIKDGARYISPIKPFELSRVTKPLSHRTLEKTLAHNGLVRIEGSRGCPWNQCAFCSVAHKYGAAWRAFPVERTLAEIVFLAKAGAKNLYFTDEDFFGNLEHFTALFSAVKALKDTGEIPSDTAFWGSTSVYTLLRFGEHLDESLALAKAVGISVLFLGIESGAKEQLKRYRKGVTKEENLLILQKLKTAGIAVDVGFIMFDAETTLDEVEENLDFCIQSGLSETVSRLAKPLRVIPHTAICEEYRKKGLLLPMPEIGELNHGYRFTDPKVKALYESLQKLDEAILESANRIQAEIRMSGGYADSARIEKLLSLRRVEYRFIRSFLDALKDREPDDEILASLLASYLQVL
ncbi:MAG: B12-binding domain-containing radical SAM protein [Clostridia bacterium]|nr:B12-binding domain-containing radical SAM protein [Clostridia bacterium]